MRRWIDLAAHVVLGGIFFVFGLNKALGFMPPPELNDEAGAFMGALAGTGYFLKVLMGVEVLGGALLLMRRFVPLALLLLAPVVVNILLFHLFLDSTGLAIALVLVVLEGYLGLVVYRDRFAPVLVARPPERPAALDTNA